MSTTLHRTPAPTEAPPRVLGHVRSELAGPLLVVTAGVHGNEPAGLIAATRVRDALEAGALPGFRGEVLFLTGNRSACARGVRFVERDLNRAFVVERIAALRRSAGGSLEAPGVEDMEALALLDALEPPLAEARALGRRVLHLDLHTSSAPGRPFLCADDTMANRQLAQGVALPLILGLVERIDGALNEYVSTLGVPSIAAEAGQHDDPLSADVHEAIVWQALVALGSLEEGEHPEAPKHAALLGKALEGAPRVVEVRYRHPVRASDRFSMIEGFTSFHPVERGQVVARDRRGPIAIDEGGVILLPLYQGLGDDGFFLGRPVGRATYELSRLFRSAGVERLLVRIGLARAREAGAWEMLEFGRGLGRLLPQSFWHLLGYRRLLRRDAGLIAMRRHVPAR